MLEPARIHETAEVSAKASIGAGTRVWHQSQIREGVRVGEECIIGKGVYLDFDVIIGRRVKIQNYACIYHGAQIDDGVFIGPHVCVTNDKYPRAITPDGELKGSEDWEVGRVHVLEGASLGAASVILPSVTIGRFALVGAGSVVTADVPDHGLVQGNPARLRAFVCFCGHHLAPQERHDDRMVMSCPACGRHVDIPEAVWAKIEQRAK